MNDVVKVVGGFLGGLAVGGAVGYFVQKKLQKKYAEIASAEIENVKDHYKLIRKEGYDPEKLVQYIQGEQADDSSSESYPQVLRDLGYSPEDGEGVVKNVFTDAAIDPDSLEEDGEGGYFSELQEYINARTPDEPYVISVGEYSETEVGYTQVAITYYEGDDVLTDEEGKVVPDVDRLIGTKSLTEFGKFSQDTNIVYVRNERLELDFEIIRDPREYVEVVLGQGARKQNLKMRDDD